MIRVARTSELSWQRNDAITYTGSSISRHWELFFQNRSQEIFPPTAASTFVKFLRKFATSVPLIFLRHNNHISVSHWFASIFMLKSSYESIRVKSAYSLAIKVAVTLASQSLQWVWVWRYLDSKPASYTYSHGAYPPENEAALFYLFTASSFASFKGGDFCELIDGFRTFGTSTWRCFF